MDKSTGEKEIIYDSEDYSVIKSVKYVHDDVLIGTGFGADQLVFVDLKNNKVTKQVRVAGYPQTNAVFNDHLYFYITVSERNSDHMLLDIPLDDMDNLSIIEIKNVGLTKSLNVIENRLNIGAGRYLHILE